MLAAEPTTFENSQWQSPAIQRLHGREHCWMQRISNLLQWLQWLSGESNWWIQFPTKKLWILHCVFFSGQVACYSARPSSLYQARASTQVLLFYLFCSWWRQDGHSRYMHSLCAHAQQFRHLLVILGTFVPIVGKEIFMILLICRT